MPRSGRSSAGSALTGPMKGSPQMRGTFTLHEEYGWCLAAAGTPLPARHQSHDTRLHLIRTGRFLPDLVLAHPQGRRPMIVLSTGFSPRDHRRLYSPASPVRPGTDRVWQLAGHAKFGASIPQASEWPIKPAERIDTGKLSIGFASLLRRSPQ